MRYPITNEITSYIFCIQNGCAQLQCLFIDNNKQKILKYMGIILNRYLQRSEYLCCPCLNKFNKLINFESDLKHKIDKLQIDCKIRLRQFNSKNTSARTPGKIFVHISLCQTWSPAFVYVLIEFS